MLDTNMEIMNQDIACLVSEAGPIFYVFKIVILINLQAVAAFGIIWMLYIYSFGRHCIQIDLQTHTGDKHKAAQFERVLLKGLKCPLTRFLLFYFIFFPSPYNFFLLSM